jgi:hypothetical protein
VPRDSREPTAGATVIRFVSTHRDACGTLPQARGSLFDSVRLRQTPDSCLGGQGVAGSNPAVPTRRSRSEGVPGSHSGPFPIFGSQSGSLDTPVTASHRFSRLREPRVHGGHVGYVRFLACALAGVARRAAGLCRLERRRRQPRCDGLARWEPRWGRFLVRILSMAVAPVVSAGLILCR